MDGKGEPCLIPPGASPWRSGEWLPVAELLKAFQGETGGPAAKTNKLLVLDCNRIDANWSLGQLDNNFAERLEDVVTTKKVPGLYVLNSTSKGQVGWSAAELRGSVFGYFFAQGLNGAADVETVGKGGKQVSLRGLRDYVKAQVNNWVIAHRDDAQEPMLVPDLPKGVDVPLVYCHSDKGTVMPKPEDVETELKTEQAGWDDLAKLWSAHEKLRKQSPAPYRAKPLEWEAFQFNLLRAEQLLQAGKDYRGEFDLIMRELPDRQKALETAPKVDPYIAPYSLALAERWGRLHDEEPRACLA